MYLRNNSPMVQSNILHHVDIFCANQLVRTPNLMPSQWSQDDDVCLVLSCTRILQCIHVAIIIACVLLATCMGLRPECWWIQTTSTSVALLLDRYKITLMTTHFMQIGRTHVATHV